MRLGLLGREGFLVGAYMQGIESFGWRGDHTFNSGAADYSLEHFLEPEVQKNNPQWTSEQIRNEATRRMEFRLTQDRAFFTKEAIREDQTTTRWEVQEIDGRAQLVTQYGDSNISLETLWEHTKEYAQAMGVPEVFNRDEMNMQLAVADALIAGKATGAAFTLSHPDSIRYVQTWTRGENGSFYSTQVDIGKGAGRDFKHHEVDAFIGQIRNAFSKQTVVLDGAMEQSYVAVKGVIHETTVIAAAKSFVETRVPPQQFLDRRFHRLEEPTFIPRENVFQINAKKSERSDYLRVIRDPRFIDEPRSIGRNHRQTSDRIIAVVPEKQVAHIKPEQIPQPTKPPKESRRHQQLVTRMVENIHREKTNTVRQLAIVEKNSVGMGAISFLLEKLASQPPRQIKTIEKSIRRNRRKKEKLAKAIHQKEAVSIKRDTLLYERKPQKKESQGQPITLGKEKRATKRRRAHARAALKRFERRVSMKKKNRLIKEIPRRERQKMRVFTETKLYRERNKRSVTKEKQRQKQKEVPFKLTKRERQRVARTIKIITKFLVKEALVAVPEGRVIAKKEHQSKIRKIREFSLAWALFLILPRSEKKTNHMSVKKRGKEQPYISQEEPSHWIFLSIIWYLAMIRESGRGSKRHQPLLPAQGVIFVANS